MKLKEEFIIHRVGDKALLIPTAESDFHGVLQGNKSFEVILRCLEGGADEEAIFTALQERFDGEETDMRADIADVLAKLRSIGALEE